jgi:hypothetical protein
LSYDTSAAAGVRRRPGAPRQLQPRAAALRAQAVVEMLVKAGALLDARDDRGRTPPGLAVARWADRA